MINILLVDVRPEIIALSEHKMSNKELCRLNLPSYKIVSLYGRSVSGGVILVGN